MDCPKCSKKMKIDRKSESNNSETGQVYERIIYVCEADDVWITTEIPITDMPTG
ncbi:MAG: hypothetical protein U0516_02610 [Candidatus Saccharibacteria bacterium]